MFDQQPPDLLRSDLAIKGIVICAAGVGISFGLCTVSVVAGAGDRFAEISVGGLSLSFIGLCICALWAAIAAIVNVVFRR